MRISLVVVVALVLAGCGTGTGLEQSSGGAWISTTVPGRVGGDSPTLLASSGDDVLVLTTSDDAEVRSSLSRDGAEFETGDPFDTGIRYTALGGVAPYAGGWFALGSGGLAEVDGDAEMLFEPVALHSDDGLAWEAVPADGFATPVDIGGLVEVDGALVAAGAARTARDPSMGGFRATAWHSVDGRSWTEVPLPDARGESVVSGLAVSDDRIVAAGRAGRSGAIWTSDDAGRSWQRSGDPALAGLYVVSGVAAAGGTVVASTTPRDSGTPGMLHSADAGRTWTVAAEAPPAGGSEGFAPVWAGGGRFFTVTSSYLDAWSAPEVCYADIERCQGDSVVALHVSDDGDRWRAVDTSGIGGGEDGEVDQVAGTDDGRVIAMRVGADGVHLHTWASGAELPIASSSPEPEEIELVELPEGAEPEPGVRYAVPLYLHCGMDWLYLGGRPWQRTDGGRDVETGAGEGVDPDWPVAQQTLFGYATLVDGVVEYSLPEGEVVATYERTGTRPPGCD